MSADTFVALWPVVEPLPFTQLVEEAKATLPSVLMKARATLTTSPRWSMRFGCDVPGSGGAEVVLVMEARAEKAKRPEYREQALIQTREEQRAERRIVDELAVEQALDGRHVILTYWERREVVRLAVERGWDDPRIERETGISARHAVRIRQSLGLPAVARAA